MRKQIVVLGAGTGRDADCKPAALALRRDEAEITVVDRDDRARVPARPAVRSVRPRRPRGHRPPAPRQLRPGIRFHQSAIEHVDIEREQVKLADGDGHALRRARGRDRRPAAARGDRGPERARLERERLHLLRPRGRTSAAEALARFDGGRLVVNIVDMPIKCPVAPLDSPSSPTGTSAGAASVSGRAHVRDAARRRLHQTGRLKHLGTCSPRRGSSSSRVQHGRGRRRRRQAHLLRRTRARLRPARHGAAPRRRRLRRALRRAR